MEHHDPETRLGEILLTELFGRVLVQGPDRGDLLPFLASAGTEIVVLDADDAEETAQELADLAAEVGILESSQLDGELFSGLVLGRLFSERVEEQVDTLLGAVADDGFVLCDLSPMPRAQRLRLERLLRSMLVDVEEIEDVAEPGALVLTGRRKARGREYAVELERDLLPLTVFVYSSVADAGLNLLILDLLYRQSVPPALVIVLDDALDDADRVPDDLWGLAGHSLTQPAIMRTKGAGRVAALREGLSQLETEFAAFMVSGERPASLWAERTVDFLASEPEVGAVISGAVERGPGGELTEHALGIESGAGNTVALLLTGAAPTGGAVVFRDGAHLDLSSAADALDDAVVFAMLLRAGAARDIGNMPLPLLVYEGTGASLAGRRIALEAYVSDVDLDHLEGSLAMFPEEDRAGLARHVVAGALHEVGLLEPALQFYREAQILEPDLVELRVDLLRALRASGDHAAFLAEAKAAQESAPEEPAFRLALAAARSDRGDFEELEAFLLEGQHPEAEAALSWSAAAVSAARLGDPALVRSLLRLRAQLADDGDFSEFEDLLVKLGD